MTVQARRSNLSVLEESATTSDPSLRGVFNEDAVSIVGDVVALLGLAISQLIGSSVPQAIAAVLIALVLIGDKACRVELSGRYQAAQRGRRVVALGATAGLVGCGRGQATAVRVFSP